MAKEDPPRLTAEALEKSRAQPNNCPVKAFMDAMDDESREVLASALKLPSREFSAPAIEDMLRGAGYSNVPNPDFIKNHRGGRGSCRCRTTP